MKIRPVGAELFHEGGRSITTKLIIAFCNFANAPKNRRFNFMFPKLQLHCNSNQLNQVETYPMYSSKALVHKVCSAYPKRSATSSKGICDISVKATLKFTYYLIKGMMFCKK